MGIISTSASVKSLWTTFTLSKESSDCTVGREKTLASSGELRSIVIGFNFVVHVARDFGVEEIAGIFCGFAQAGAEFFSIVAFGGSACAGTVNGFFDGTNFGR